MSLIQGVLVPLSIPTGWVIRLNNWFYQEPLLSNGMPNSLFQKEETLLILSRFEAEYHPHAHFGRDFYLSLIWEGDMVLGNYVLRFYEDADEDNILYTFKTKSAAEMQAKINECLDLWSIEEFPSPYKATY